MEGRGGEDGGADADGPFLLHPPSLSRCCAVLSWRRRWGSTATRRTGRPSWPPGRDSGDGHPLCGEGQPGSGAAGSEGDDGEAEPEGQEEGRAKTRQDPPREGRGEKFFVLTSPLPRQPWVVGAGVGGRPRRGPLVSSESPKPRPECAGSRISPKCHRSEKSRRHRREQR
jgi:hypothetical protein